MEFWFLQDMQRLALERDAIRHLEETAEWLDGTDWILDGGLCVDAVIRAHGHNYQVRMSYPALFPSITPIVRSQNPDERWSSHQYLSGTLCLEWGPDTWHPDVTGAQVLESAYKLLYTENPLGSNQHIVAPSRHRLSTGQTLRGSYGRFYVGNELADYLAGLPAKTSGLLEFSIQWQSKSFLVFIQQVQPKGAQAWNDTSIPSGVSATETTKGAVKHGVFFKTNLDSNVISGIKSMKEIEDALERAGHRITSLTGEGDVNVMGLEQPPLGVLLLDSANEPYFFLLLDLKEDIALRLEPVRSHRPTELHPRIPADLQALSGKSVGIVGLGSVGSKMALSLARTGIFRFLLVDEDIFLPENVCRHVLDWQNIGEHKVDAVAEMLLRIAPDIKVDVSYLYLTGQESTASLSGALNKLGHCDLLIDATAAPRVFNLTSAVATTYERPLVWVEVYAGGIGGMAARSRPGRDPDPHTMRAAYHHFTSETPAADLVTTRDYAAENADGDVLSASDADVGILACCATRLAIDTLLEREPSMFPHSMYLVGLARSWIFKAPFHTVPIETDHLPHREQSTDPVSNEVLSDNITFISNLLEKQPSADSSS
jgi:sulfur-carrier protein adenylyltransferase/sulfurtransferase